jgi:hyperosmotically inducible protein
VKTALLNDGQLQSLEISVVTRNGEVMLSGFVESLAQANHAVDVTNGVEGVATVLNHMTVKNSVAK